MSSFFDVMDGPTSRHLYAWLDQYVPRHLRDEALNMIISAVSEYPDLLEKGRSWSEVKAVGERIAERRSR